MLQFHAIHTFRNGYDVREYPKDIWIHRRVRMMIAENQADQPSIKAHRINNNNNIVTLRKSEKEFVGR